MNVEILGKPYPLIPVDPMPVSVLIGRTAISVATQQALGPDGSIPIEVLLELRTAALVLLAPRWSPVRWSTPVRACGVAALRDALDRCPEADRERMYREINDAGYVAWNHLFARKIEQASEEGVKAAEVFSPPQPADR